MLNKKMTLIKLFTKRELIEDSDISLSEQMLILNKLLEDENKKEWKNYLNKDEKKENLIKFKKKIREKIEIEIKQINLINKMLEDYEKK